GNDFNLFPGMGAVKDTAETNFQWNKGNFMVFGTPDVIDGSARDLNNSPTTILRAGLALGKVTASAKLKQWDPPATDGTEVLYGFNPYPMKMTDFDGNNVDRNLAVVIAGYIKAAQVITSTTPFTINDLLRDQGRGRFWFDDNLVGGSLWYPIKREIAKT